MGDLYNSNLLKIKNCAKAGFRTSIYVTRALQMYFITKGATEQYQ